MNELRIRSVREGAERVELVSVGEFFENLGALWWKGWDGAKSYESLEGQLSLTATRDSLGHVELRVALRDGMGAADWVAEGTLLLESGQLPELGRVARSLFSAGASRMQRVEADEVRARYR